jgi:hypothetical protein
MREALITWVKEINPHNSRPIGSKRTGSATFIKWPVVDSTSVEMVTTPSSNHEYNRVAKRHSFNEISCITNCPWSVYELPDQIRCIELGAVFLPHNAR